MISRTCLVSLRNWCVCGLGDNAGWCWISLSPLGSSQTPISGVSSNTKLRLVTSKLQTGISKYPADQIYDLCKERYVRVGGVDYQADIQAECRLNPIMPDQQITDRNTFLYKLYFVTDVLHVTSFPIGISLICETTKCIKIFHQVSVNTVCNQQVQQLVMLTLCTRN